MSELPELRSALSELQAGDSSAWDRLLSLVYGQLRAQAHLVFRGERNTLQATALLHDALADLLESDLSTLSIDDPGRFFALVSRILRNRLLDHVRRRNASKRGGGGVILSLDVNIQDVPVELRVADGVALHDILEKLHIVDERLWTVTELKFFCGLTNVEIGAALGVSARVV